MASVVWSDAALYQLAQIKAYIAAFDPLAAERMVANLSILGDSLADFANRGRPCGDGLREMTSVRPYLLRCEAVGDRVMILRVRHAARLPLDSPE